MMNLYKRYPDLSASEVERCWNQTIEQHPNLLDSSKKITIVNGRKINKLHYRLCYKISQCLYGAVMDAWNLRDLSLDTARQYSDELATHREQLDLAARYDIFYRALCDKKASVNQTIDGFEFIEDWDDYSDTESMGTGQVNSALRGDEEAGSRQVAAAVQPLSSDSIAGRGRLSSSPGSMNQSNAKR